jgi:hypothetical protein
MGRILLALLLAACGSNLKLTLIQGTARRPSNVAVYFTVDKDNGDPVPGLTAEQFKIFEDSQPVSVLESKQTILNPEVSASHYTMLLVDMSGSVSGSGDVPVIVQSAQAFAERLQQYQKIAVYTFDGSPDIHEISGFASGPGVGANAARLSTFKAADPSTNLNGAIISALKVLHRQMSSASTPLVFGTLVVFTDGSDRAGRVTRDQLHKELEKNELDVLVIGVGTEIDGDELHYIGKNGAILTKDRTQIASAFDQAAARIEGFSKRFYLLGYCSPARAGTHVVRIETNAAGASGYLEYKFDARGFGPNCDPNQPPSFDIHRPKPVALR